MIIALSFEKRGHIVDHDNKPHKSFTFVEVTETLYRKLVARNRFVAEAHEFLEGIRSVYEEKYVRQHARNAGLSGDGDIEEVRAGLVARVLENSIELLNARGDTSDAFAQVKTVLTSWRESFVARMAAEAPAPPAAPPVAPPLPLDGEEGEEDEEGIKEPSAPLVPDEALADGAWEALVAAYDAQDYKAARTALSALSDEPTPAKAVEMWPVVEAALRTRGLLK